MCTQLNARRRTSALLGVLILAGMLGGGELRAGQTVVNAGATFTFTLPAIATNYAWRMEGTLVSTNGIVGTNGPAFSYSPMWFDVGTHELACYETLSNGVASNTLWQVRVRIALPASGTNYYVATNGLDSNPGTLAAPFLTLEGARNTIRSNGLPAGGVTVWLRGGTYFRTNTFVLTSLDSGTALAPVVYQGYPGETPVISAGKPISASAFVPLNSGQTNRVPPGINPTNILELDLPTAGIAHRGPFPAHFGTWVTANIYGASGSSGSASGGICDLFYNGQRMWLSRYPSHNLTNDNLDTTYLLMDGVARTGPGSTNYLNNPGIYTNSSGAAVAVGCAFHYYASNATEVARWQTALTNGGAWVSGFWRVDWQNDAMQVLGIDLTNMVIEITNTVTVQGGIGSKYSQPLGSLSERYWVMNLLEDMDQPGEWAMDFNRNKIYFYAPGPINNGSVVISDSTAPIVQLTQTTNVVFQSLTFEDGLGEGIVVGTNCQNNLVVGCTLQNMNNYPVDINGGYTNGVVSCRLQNLAGGGVLLHGGNASSSPRVPARDFVVNNIITNSGVIARVYNTPVDVGGNGAGSSGTNVVGMRIAHNFLTVMPHLGVLHGTTWDAIVEYNNLYNFGQVSSGIGGIYGYTYFVSSGNNYFRYNLVHDSPLEDGISFDQDHRQAHVYGNIVDLNAALSGEHQCLGSETGSQAIAGEQQYLDHYNNLGLYANHGFDVVSPVGSTIEENAMINCLVPYTWEQVVIGVNGNTFVGSSASALQSGPNLTYTNDPGFVNFSSEDLRLVPTAQIYADMPLFTQLPFEMMGLYNDETWSNAIGYSPYVMNTNTSASGVGQGAATLNGTLVYPQFDLNTTVFACWGTNDGGTNPVAWQNVTNLGVLGAGPVSVGITNILSTTYYYRFYATNAYGQSWAGNSLSFFGIAAGHTPANLVWNGSGATNIWDEEDATNLVWLNGATPADFWNGDTVNFTDSETNSPAVNLAAVVLPAAVFVNASQQNYVFSGIGKISGNATWQKSGAGTVMVLTTNDYNGGTTVNSGTLQVGNGSVSGAIGTGNIVNNGSLIFNQPGNTTINGNITGTGGLTNTGGGTLTLAANNAYSGGTTINGGAVAIGADAGLGAPGGGLVLNGGVLQVTSAGLFPLNNRPVTLKAGGGTFNLANNLTISNPITGPGSLTLTGSGTLILTASNLYSGPTIVNQGTLQVDNGGGLGSVPTNIFLNGGSLLYARTNACVQNGFISGSSTNSAINNLLTTGPLALSFASGGNLFSNVFNGASQPLALVGNVFSNLFNSASAPLTLAGGSNYFTVLGTDLRNLSTSGVLLLTNGYWYTPRIGGNGGPYMLGTNIIANATLETSGARGVRGLWQIQSGGVLRVDTNHYPGAVNENRFDFGTGGLGAGETVMLTLAAGGTLDIWGVQYDGFSMGQNVANATVAVVQNGGTALIGVNGGSGNQNLVFNAAGANGVTEYLLNGGLLKVAGTLSANAPAAGGTNLFRFNGGTLAVNTFNATNLFVQPSNSLVNLGGVLAPGGVGTPGRTIIQGNYFCSNRASLAIDLGGTVQANAFTNPANYYDFVSVSGTAALGGSLSVSLINNYQSSISTNAGFTMLTASGGVSGAFTNVFNGRVSVANVPGASFQVVTNSTSVILTNYAVVPTPPILGGLSLVSGNLVITGTNGTAGANYLVLATTNLSLSATNWNSIATQQFGPGGSVNFTNPLNSNGPQTFYRLRLP